MKQLRELVEKVNSQFGDGMMTSLAEKPSDVAVVPTGIMALDAALQIPRATFMGEPVIGGYPKRRVSAVWGPEGGGKTTMMMAHLATLAKAGGTGVYIDVEQKGDIHYFKQIFKSLDAPTEPIGYTTPRNAEEALTTVRRALNKVDSVVLDSIATLIPRSRKDTDIGEMQPGMLARIVKDWLLKSNIGLSDTAVVVVNQVREQIGGYSSYSERTPGGHALDHQAAVSIRVARINANLKRDGKDAGIDVKAKVRKNQVGKPNEEALFKIWWGEGPDFQTDTLETAMKLGLLQRAGAYYYLVYENPAGIDEDNKVQGKRKLREAFDRHPEMYKQLRGKMAEVVRTGVIE
jgi:recombination protein RecA